MNVRPERARDFAEIEQLVTLAFEGRWNEPALVRRLRAQPGFRPEFALVSEDGGRVTGHVMLTDVQLQSVAASRTVLVLAPLSVLPAAQGQGVGSALVREATALAGRSGEPLVVVLGDPAYYQRFGFEPARSLGIEPPDGVPPDAFSALRLRAYDAALAGTVRFPAVFEETGTL